MSFGFSIGDFFAAGQFAWTVYKSCKGAGPAFAEVRNEVLALHTAVKEVQDEAENPDSIFNRTGAGKKEELRLLVSNCMGVLQQLNKLLVKYKSLGTPSKRTWDRLKFGSQDLQDIRDKLMSHTSSLTLFLTTLGTGSLGRIEKKLDELIADVRAGRREPSVLTVTDDNRDEADIQWEALQRELADTGFTKSEVEGHKHWIKAKLAELAENGGLEEEVPSGSQRMDEMASLSPDVAEKEDQIPTQPLSTSETRSAKSVRASEASRSLFPSAYRSPMVEDASDDERENEAASNDADIDTQGTRAEIPKTSSAPLSKPNNHVPESFTSTAINDESRSDNQSFSGSGSEDDGSKQRKKTSTVEHITTTDAQSYPRRGDQASEASGYSDELDGEEEPLSRRHTSKHPRYTIRRAPAVRPVPKGGLSESNSEYTDDSEGSNYSDAADDGTGTILPSDSSSQVNGGATKLDGIAPDRRLVHEYVVDTFGRVVPVFKSLSAQSQPKYPETEVQWNDRRSAPTKPTTRAKEREGSDKEQKALRTGVQQQQSRQKRSKFRNMDNEVQYQPSRRQEQDFSGYLEEHPTYNVPPLQTSQTYNNVNLPPVFDASHVRYNDRHPSGGYPEPHIPYQSHPYFDKGSSRPSTRPNNDGGGFKFSSPEDVFREFMCGQGGHEGEDIDDPSPQTWQRRPTGQVAVPEVTTVEKALALSLEDLFKGVPKKMKIKQKATNAETGRFTTQYKVLEMYIKPGSKKGSKIKFSGVGEQEEGGRQNLHFIIEEKPHHIFTRQDNDLYATVDITLEESLCGWKRTISTIEGRELRLDFAGPTAPGTREVFPGLGMPLSKMPSTRGDYIVTVNVKYPTSLSLAQRSLLRQALNAKG